ncbi:hypothetical protein VP01_3714g2, partial [Puccinia sorghi]
PARMLPGSLLRGQVGNPRCIAVTVWEKKIRSYSRDARSRAFLVGLVPPTRWVVTCLSCANFWPIGKRQRIVLIKLILFDINFLGQNLCNAHHKVIGIMEADGRVARVDSSGKLLDQPNGYCVCHPTGLACPEPPMNNIFKEIVFCAVESTNKCP